MTMRRTMLIAARAGVAPSALRYYEAQGLIASERTAGNQRRYQRAVLRRVAVIRAGRTAGLPLATIGDALAPCRHTALRPSATGRACRALAAATRRAHRAARALRDQLASCIGCGCLSLRACRLFNPDDRAPSEVRARAIS